ncbi:MAG: hypothetical protein IPN73_20125 [Saprospiraceae bacterium]|nr:hypothetical protein [Saprospiraceae bacterium]
MKNILFLLLNALVACTIISCTDTNNRQNIDILGHWKWVKAPIVFVTNSSGEKDTLEFNNTIYSFDSNNGYSIQDDWELSTLPATNGTFLLVENVLEFMPSYTNDILKEIEKENKYYWKDMVLDRDTLKVNFVKTKNGEISSELTKYYVKQ